MATDLGFIKFRKDHSYAKRTPTLVSNTAAGADELARWVLDWNGVLYKDERHAPYLCTGVADKLSGGRGGRNHPVLIHTDVLIYGTDSVVQYYNQRGLPHKKLTRRHRIIRRARLYGCPIAGSPTNYTPEGEVGLMFTCF